MKLSFFCIYYDRLKLLVRLESWYLEPRKQIGMQPQYLNHWVSMAIYRLTLLITQWYVKGIVSWNYVTENRTYWPPDWTHSFKCISCQTITLPTRFQFLMIFSGRNFQLLCVWSGLVNQPINTSIFEVIYKKLISETIFVFVNDK